jgi:hypothetical protein
VTHGPQFKHHWQNSVPCKHSEQNEKIKRFDKFAIIWREAKDRVPTEKYMKINSEKNAQGFFFTRSANILGSYKTKSIYDISVCAVLFVLKKELFVLH